MHPDYYYKYLKLFKENSYELNGLNITIHKEMPKNWPSNLKKIKKYVFRHSLARETTGEDYPKDTAYQITIPNTVIQWIDKTNCLLVFLRDYESAPSGTSQSPASSSPAASTDSGTLLAHSLSRRHRWCYARILM